MQKRISVGLMALFVGVCYAQTPHRKVGINEPSPKATLHIKGQADQPTTPDGNIAPRLTGDQLKAKDVVYTENQKGAIVYVTEKPNSLTKSKKYR